MSSPYMQLFVADYLGDTQHLTTEQHGAYLLLLMAMWRAPGCRLPNDPARLARIARVNPRRWHLFQDVMALFVDAGDGSITQKRLEREHQKALSISQKRSVSGEAGGRAKSLKTNDQAVASATDLPPHRARVPEPYPDSTSVSEPKGSSTEERARETRTSFDAFWSEYPHKVGKPRAWRAWGPAIRAAPAPEIMAGLRRYVRGKPSDRPWLNPATFLNQHRWADQEAPTTGPPANERPQQVSVPRPLHPSVLRQTNGNDDDGGFRFEGVFRGGPGPYSAH